ncbi:hypothetical protein Z948_3412 [Sulfitobacter donghicola DSW-25 = KCTC 12864 = JCM 14565]|nr:hypothetical protein Z948_3412 [Sulfitobacter donghicola DSW-25 = KCTC 12864 = JCM 14565]
MIGFLLYRFRQHSQADAKRKATLRHKSVQGRHFCWMVSGVAPSVKDEA